MARAHDQVVVASAAPAQMLPGEELVSTSSGGGGGTSAKASSPSFVAFAMYGFLSYARVEQDFFSQTLMRI